MSHHPERTARNVRPVNQPPSFLKLINYHSYRSLRRKTHNRFENLRKALRLTVNRKSKLRFKLFLKCLTKILLALALNEEIGEITLRERSHQKRCFTNTPPSGKNRKLRVIAATPLYIGKHFKLICSIKKFHLSLLPDKKKPLFLKPPFLL